MNNLIFSLMDRAGIKPEAVKEPAVIENTEQSKNSLSTDTFRPNRKMRRAKMPEIPNAVKTTRRYDKVLGKHYGIPKAFRQHAKRYGLGMEYVCSTLLEHKAIEYKPLPEDLTHRIYWRKK